MEITRRMFLHGLTVAVAAASLTDLRTAFGQKAGEPELFPIPVESYSEPLYSMTARHFDGLVGERFAIVGSDGLQADLFLLEVTRLELLSNTTRGYYGESFSLLFARRGKRPLPQDTYEFRNDSLGQFSALLVPIGAAGTKYEVIINHITR